MGIALSDPESGGRSKLASVAFTAIGLAFFFGVGLAGGAAYKIYFSEDGGPQTATQVSPPAAAPAARPEQAFVAATPDAVEHAAEKAVPDPAPSEAAAAPAPEPQAAPMPSESSEPAMTAQAAPPAAPVAAEPAPQPPSAPSQATIEAAVAAAPAAETAPQTAAPAPAAVTPPKPAPAAKAHRGAPQLAALHPPAAPSGAAGRFHVQFGAFANEENARRVQSALEAAGLKVVVSHEAGASGNPLFIVRTPSYPDRAAALSAAQNVQSRAKRLANPVAIDYAIIPDRAAGEQHAQR